MSFSGTVKEELAGRIPRRDHCCRAEAAAMLLYGFRTRTRDGQWVWRERLTQAGATRKFFTLLRKTGTMGGSEDVLTGTAAEDLCQRMQLRSGADGGLTLPRDAALLQRDCCRRAFLRGAFLCCGTVNDPQKTAHLSFHCHSEEAALLLLSLLQEEIPQMHRTRRADRVSVYTKDGSAVVTLLALMDAPVAVMAFENGRIYKEIRSGVNRKVNCEAANISRTVSAAVRQTEQIRFIEAHGGLSQLPESLQEIARLRLEQEDLPLEALGQLLVPPLGKSGVNHRLRRIGAFADHLALSGGFTE